jgi:tryptophan 2,3-dioxygenase
MNISENAEAILNEIDQKYASINQKNRNALRRLTLVQTNDILGLQTDALLNIQTQRTTLPDEMVSCIIR